MAAFSPTDKSAGVTLSNGGLTATADAISYRGARADLFRNSAAGGRFYFEVTIGVMGVNLLVSAGFSRAGGSLTTSVGNSAGGVGYHVSTNRIQRETSAEFIGASFSQPVAGDVLGLGIDLGTRKIIVSKNGVFSSSNLSDAVAVNSYAPTVVIYNAGDQVTANFGATPFGNIPVGYDPWDVVARIPALPSRTVRSPRPTSFIGL